MKNYDIYRIYDEETMECVKICYRAKDVGTYMFGTLLSSKRISKNGVFLTNLKGGLLANFIKRLEEVDTRNHLLKDELFEL